MGQGGFGVFSKISAYRYHFWLFSPLYFLISVATHSLFTVCLLLGYYHVPKLHLGFAHTSLDLSIKFSTEEFPSIWSHGISGSCLPPSPNLSPTGSCDQTCSAAESSLDCFGPTGSLYVRTGDSAA